MSASAELELQPRSALRMWAPAASMTLLGLLSYVDRSVLAILSPTILADLHLSATQYGYAILVFSLCYMVANPIWGAWMDRAGLWVTTLCAVLLWSLASGSHGLMMGFVGMCVARGVLGFGEGATFPAGLKTVTETLPAEKRSFGLGVAYSGGSTGALITPLLITPIAIRWGWRAAFGVTAAFGFAWIVLWFILRTTGLYAPPRLSATIRREETEGISTSRWSRNLFAAALVYGLGAAPLAFGLYAAPLYLTRVLHLGQASLGHLLWLPPLGWEAGYLIFGRVADALRRRDVKRGVQPRRPGAIFAVLSVASIGIVLTPMLARSASPVAATMTLFVFEMFIAGGFVVFALSDGMMAIPKQHSAFLAGFSISAWALVTGALMPWIGHLFDRKNYDLSFWCIACLPLLGTVLWSVLHCEPGLSIEH
ncbi:MAG: MFS transporter [Edaphobacter sp.]|uniref:MFS transporter n=1 Tax=Edaphobacter sp. TaxID=1934404 RepID=UPI002393331A|nr:MFS transporter [Edaphobacter sp.]MDE1176578.1 MFS transporter [Edaphobacter sp.]